MIKRVVIRSVRERRRVGVFPEHGILRIRTRPPLRWRLECNSGVVGRAWWALRRSLRRDGGVACARGAWGQRSSSILGGDGGRGLHRAAARRKGRWASARCLGGRAGVMGWEEGAEGRAGVAGAERRGGRRVGGSARRERQLVRPRKGVQGGGARWAMGMGGGGGEGVWEGGGDRRKREECCERG